MFYRLVNVLFEGNLDFNSVWSIVKQERFNSLDLEAMRGEMNHQYDTISPCGINSGRCTYHTYDYIFILFNSSSHIS